MAPAAVLEEGEGLRGPFVAIGYAVEDAAGLGVPAVMCHRRILQHGPENSGSISSGPCRATPPQPETHFPAWRTA